MRQFNPAIQAYLGSKTTPKCLEIGACGNLKPGWLSTDLVSYRAGIVPMDVTRPFPIDEGSFDYVYSEHMIEHLTLAQGCAMLRECHAALRPGGVCRVVTPSIEFLMSLFGSEAQPYVEWSATMFMPDAPKTPAVVFNNFVRAWGHQFIYDRPGLWDAMSEAGFRDLLWEEIGGSRHRPLRGLESTGRLPAGFLAMESMILEGVK